MKQSIRYLNNAREILKSVPIEDNRYTDKKPVKEAMGTAYLAVFEAINENLLKKGIHNKDLPRSVDACRDALRRNFRVHDGKLLREFEMLYDHLHIAGYYGGNLYNTDVVKKCLKAARQFSSQLKKNISLVLK